VRATAINGSPQKDGGTTALVLNPFLAGMRSAGAQVDLMYARDMRIRPCDGDFSCWFATPGRCRYRDMDDALSQLRESSIWVFGIPLFLPMPGEVQNLLNRLMPLYRGSLRVVEGRRMYAQRESGLRLKRMVLVSSCAFWGLENFDKLVHPMQEIATAADAEFAGALLRPHSGVFARLLKTGDEAASQLVAAASDAGRDLVQNGTISHDALETVRTPLVSFDDFVREWDVSV